MNNNDNEYMVELTDRIRSRDSNAVAEFFAITYQKQFEIAYKQLGDYQLAKEVLQEIYIYAIRNMDSLTDPKLLSQWLNQINCRLCFKYRLQDRDYMTIEGSQFRFGQIAELPLSEAQAIMLRYCSNFHIGETAKIMECSKADVKRYTANGLNRLKKIMQQ
ncbi:MAG: hypothetical protein KBS68_04030 [Clostridiales bacterium]|nr:hypothetical protein [Candidatus Crickella merdequi]